MFSLYSLLKNKSGLLLQSYKRNRCKLCHRTVKFLFKKNLLFTNSITSGLCMVLGDLAQQEIEYRRQIVTERYDWDRVWRMFCVGTALGPAHHYYYLYLDKILPQANPKTILKKVLADQCFASPITIVCFFIGMGLLEHKSWTEIYDELAVKMKYAYLGDCLFWPPVQIVNFYYLPTHYRVIYINFATMVFNIFMSYMKHYDQHEEKNE